MPMPAAVLTVIKAMLWNVLTGVASSLLKTFEKPLARFVFKFLDEMVSKTDNEIDDEWVAAGRKAYFSPKTKKPIDCVYPKRD